MPERYPGLYLNLVHRPFGDSRALLYSLYMRNQASDTGMSRGEVETVRDACCYPINLKWRDRDE